MKLLLNILLSFLIPISAHTQVEVFIDNPVEIQWEGYGTGYQYMVKIYQLKNDTSELIYNSDWIKENSTEIQIEEESSYEWKLYIREGEKTCDNQYQCFNIESGYFDFYFSELPQEEIGEDILATTKEIVQDNIPNKVSKEKDKNVLGVSEKKYFTKKEFIEKEKESNKEKKDKNTIDTTFNDKNYCRYSYNIKKEKFKLKECHLEKPVIKSSEYYEYNNKYIINSKGNYQKEIKIYIDDVICKDFDLLNTKTWFRCEENIISENEYKTNLDHEVYFYRDQIIPPNNYIFNKNFFEISTLLKNLPNSLVFKSYFSLKYKENWLDQELAIKIPTSFTENISHRLDNKNAPYAFPFSEIINVNQWHGCTDYQCPHTGIDFAASKEKIYASDNGKVVAKGYDTYYGECHSGGNYLVIKYDSGHHMAYFHLDKSLVKSNQKINRGDLIAISGNSGSHNCQPLGDHLHFELRENRRQRTHINPIEYININWNLVRTNMANRYPKRLSGDNPHPSY